MNISIEMSDIIIIYHIMAIHKHQQCNFLIINICVRELLGFYKKIKYAIIYYMLNICIYIYIYIYICLHYLM